VDRFNVILRKTKKAFVVDIHSSAEFSDPLAPKRKTRYQVSPSLSKSTASAPAVTKLAL